MPNNDCESRNNLKEFTETDVKNIYDSIDESNGFGIDFAINLYRSNMQDQSEAQEIISVK